jgi:hypothetical protein
MWPPNHALDANPSRGSRVSTHSTGAAERKRATCPIARAREAAPARAEGAVFCSIDLVVVVVVVVGVGVVVLVGAL